MKKSFLFFLLFTIISCANAQTKTTIYFDSNKSEIRSDAVKILDSLTVILQKANSYQVNINAYCDNTGTDENNQLLSEQRAAAVLNYLKKKNVSSQFTTTKGFGETDPVASNDNETGKAKNRRAEIIVNIIAAVTTQPAPATIPDIQNKETFNESSTLTDLEVGKTLVLKNLNFEGGTALLLPEAKPTLEILLKTMQDNPTLEIEIGGHVCCKDDMPLSILRAQTVYRYLVRKGINKDRMTYKGYSRSKPLVEDDSNEINARLNRRVEITILKK